MLSGSRSRRSCRWRATSRRASSPRVWNTARTSASPSSWASRRRRDTSWADRRRATSAFHNGSARALWDELRLRPCREVVQQGLPARRRPTPVCRAYCHNYVTPSVGGRLSHHPVARAASTAAARGVLLSTALGAKRQSATVDSLHSTGLLWNGSSIRRSPPPSCCSRASRITTGSRFADYEYRGARI